jgi:hypothetical protein
MQFLSDCLNKIVFTHTRWPLSKIRVQEFPVSLNCCYGREKKGNSSEDRLSFFLRIDLLFYTWPVAVLPSGSSTLHYYPANHDTSMGTTVSQSLCKLFIASLCENMSILPRGKVEYTLHCVLSMTPVTLTDAKSKTDTSILLHDIL